VSTRDLFFFVFLFSSCKPHNLIVASYSHFVYYREQLEGRMRLGTYIEHMMASNNTADGNVGNGSGNNVYVTARNRLQATRGLESLADDLKGRLPGRFNNARSCQLLLSLHLLPNTHLLFLRSFP
jgi:hypothetical protein